MSATWLTATVRPRNMMRESATIDPDIIELAKALARAAVARDMAAAKKNRPHANADLRPIL